MSATSVTSNGDVGETRRPAALVLEDVEAGYGHTTVLRNVSLTVPAGSVVALIGSNGAGKTTLLKTASGVLAPTRGRIHLDGQDVTRVSSARRSQRGLCHIPEGRGIYRSLNVRDNLTMQSPRGRERQAIEKATSAFPILGNRLAQQAGTLSGGEQQMLSMAAAYVRDADVILVDEASLGLAPIIVDVIFTFLQNVAREGAALLIVDQYVTRALTMAEIAYVLRRGEIVYRGDPGTLLAGDVFQQYLG